MNSKKHNLVNLAQVCPSIVLDIRYATHNNFWGSPIYSSPICYLHIQAAAALQCVQQELLALQLGLKVFDGYRPLPIQQKMWDLIQDERYVVNPAINKGRHTRGTAVDLTLIDCNGNELEMPSAFDDFSEKAQSDYPHVSEKARKNRAFLKEVMKRFNFIQEPKEWWHFDFLGWRDDTQFPPLDIALEDLEKTT